MERATSLDELRTTFGAEATAPEARRDRVTALFDRIAPRYDLMNDLMSFGLHRHWKAVMRDWAVAALAERDGPLLDLAAGTGDIGLSVARALPGRRVILADASAGMLDQARPRAAALPSVQIVHAPAEALPLADGSCAAVTLAFGLRNMTDPAGALREVARVLAPGGALILLEFSRPAAWFAPFYGVHARHIIPRLGAAVARDREAYQYLVESIQRFPARDDIARELAAAGLRLAQERAFVFGIARLQRAIRPEVTV